MSDDDEKRFAPREPVAPAERIGMRLPAPRQGEELPLRLLVIGDHGRPREPGAPWMPEEVTPETLHRVVFGEGIELDLEVPNRIDPAGSSIHAKLRFRRFSDLEPGQIAEAVPELRELLALRRAFTSIKAPLGSEKAFRRRIQRALSDPRERAALVEILGDDATRARAAAHAADVAAWRAEAASSDDPSRLDELGQSSDPIIARHVARNEATPTARLEALSFHFPEEVAKHPSVLRACKADPTASRTLGSRCAARVLVATGVEEGVLDRWARGDDEKLRTIVACCPRSSAETLVHLTEDPVWSIAWTVASNPSAPWKALQSLLARWKRESAGGVRHHCAGDLVLHPNWRPDALVAFAQAAPGELAVALRGRTDVPETLLARLWSIRRDDRGVSPFSSEDDLALRTTLAADPRTAAPIVRALATDRNREVREAVAGNPAADASLLEALAGDADATVRRTAMAHPAADRRLLLRMLEEARRAPATDEHAIEARRALVTSLALRLADVAPLVTDPDMAVRSCLLRRPDVSDELLAELGRDPDPIVREDAQRRARARARR